MSEVEDFIYGFEADQREVMLRIHRLLTRELNLTEKIRFKIPFYYGRTWICYLNPKKGGITEFAFIRGNELSNIQGILENKGRKQVYGVEFKTVSQIPIRELNEIIQEAILIDETRPYRIQRKG